MAKQLNAAQKRGLLIVLGALVVLVGWRWRASQAAGGTPLDTLQTPVATAASSRIDLNTADTTLLQTVSGIGAASARRIVRYRSLIGGFTSADQLLKVWGITPENFIRIEEQVYADTTTAAFAALRKARPQRDGYNRDPRPRFTDRRTFGNKSYGEPSNNQHSQEATASTYPAGQSASPAPAPPARRQQLDINTADSLDLVAIAGIGPSTARNILKYRSLIYFFDSLDQLGEVWGIRPENLERMKPYLTVGDSRKGMPHLRINEMSVDEMGRHKYLGFKEARIIVAYRDMHGPFADMAALQKVQVVDPAKWEKLRPYLVF